MNERTTRSVMGVVRTVALVAVVMMSFSACMGYTLVRKSELYKRPTVTVIDSSTVVALRQQLAAAKAQLRSDSIWHANHPKTPTVFQDSIIKVRDAEVASLKEQLGKAQEELERIKQRMRNPK